ncbi:MAG: cell division protein ZapA [Bacteroidales bacterium]|nr:cell division protein ZapA [Bacteroidales bacterium]
MEQKGQSISIRIADRTYPMKVNSPEDEELIRKAAELINGRIEKYNVRYPGKGLADVLSFVALNICKSHLALQKQLDDVLKGEENLIRELDGYLDNIDKNSR